MREPKILGGVQRGRAISRSSAHALVLFLGLCAGASDAAVTVHEPGFSDVSVASIPWSSGTATGGIAEVDSGDLYCVGGFSWEIFRKRQSDPAFTVFAQLDLAQREYGIAILAYGSDLYVGMTSGFILKLSTAAAPGQTPVVVTPVPLPGEVLDLEPPSLGTSAIAATSVGVYEVDLVTGQFNLIHTAGGASVSAIAPSPSGSSLLGVDHGTSEMFELHPGAPWTRSVYYSDGATTFLAPDGIAVHPQTGEIYAACQGTDTIERFDSSGARLATFLSGATFEALYYTTPMTFSRDGRTLYYLNKLPPSFEVRAISGFPAATAPTGGIIEPAPMSTHRSEIDVGLDVDDPAGLPVTCTFYYSTDSGVSYDTCQEGECSPLANPSTPLPTPSLSSRFIWNSYADGVGLFGVVNVDIRIVMDNSVDATERLVSFAVDNSVSVNLTAPICGSTDFADVKLVFDTESAVGSTTVADFEFTTDGGVTWTACTASASSPLSNPSSPIPCPSLSSRFIWNSYADSVGLVTSTPVEVRVNARDGSAYGFSTRNIDLDSPGLTVAIRSPGPGAKASGRVEILLDADYGLPYGLGEEPVLLAPEYSVDGGLTFQPCNRLGTNPAPTLPKEISSRIVASSFIWNSVDDGVGLVSAQNVRIRARAAQLSTLVTDIVEVTVANTRCGLLCGDCNSSGIVDVVDSLLAAQFDVGLGSLDPESFQNCNVANPSVASVTVLDALAISRFVVGLDGMLTCCP